MDSQQPVVGRHRAAKESMPFHSQRQVRGGRAWRNPEQRRARPQSFDLTGSRKKMRRIEEKSRQALIRKQGGERKPGKERQVTTLTMNKSKNKNDQNQQESNAHKWRS